MNEYTCCPAHRVDQMGRCGSIWADLGRSVTGEIPYIDAAHCAGENEKARHPAVKEQLAQHATSPAVGSP